MTFEAFRRARTASYSRAETNHGELTFRRLRMLTPGNLADFSDSVALFFNASKMGILTGIETIRGPDRL